jgi:hypothetical protein
MATSWVSLYMKAQQKQLSIKDRTHIQVPRAKGEHKEETEKKERECTSHHILS